MDAKQLNELFGDALQDGQTVVKGMLADVCRPGRGILEAAELMPTPPDFDADFGALGTPVREALSAKVFTTGLPSAQDLGALTKLARTRIILWANAYELERRMPTHVVASAAPLALRQLLPAGHLFKDWRVDNPYEAFVWQPRAHNFRGQHVHASTFDTKHVHGELVQQAIEDVKVSKGMTRMDYVTDVILDAAYLLVPSPGWLDGLSADERRQIADWACRRANIPTFETPPQALRDWLTDEGHPFLSQKKALPVACAPKQ